MEDLRAFINMCKRGGVKVVFHLPQQMADEISAFGVSYNDIWYVSKSVILYVF